MTAPDAGYTDADRVPFPVPEHVVSRARRIALALQPLVEDLVVRALTSTYREAFGDGYLARPSNLDAESPPAEPS